MKLYRGIVEDNVDPDKIGRVRVRIFGVHSSDKELVKTDELPFAEIIGNNGFGLVGGIGLSSVLKVGTWVWVILENDETNKPIILGTISGINSEVGEVFPTESRAYESDINRLLRAESLDETTIHKKINTTLDKQDNITDSVSGTNVSQSEPESTDDLTEYPNASVIETASGHVIQFDDTPDNERIRLYHKTGSYIEIKPDGSIVQKSVSEEGSNHYIHMSVVNNHIAKSVKTYIEENLDEIIKGYVRRKVGSLNEHITGTLKQTVDGPVSIIHNNGTNWNIKGDLNIKASGNIKINGATINLN